MEKLTKWEIPHNVIDIQRDFLKKIIDTCSGMKALIFDDTTVKTISLVLMQSEGFEKDAYLVENITYLGEEKISSMVGIFILSPSNTSIQKLKTLLKEPIFKEYHLFFTAKIDDTILRMLAEADEFDVVKRLQEIFIEYLALTPETMTAGLPTTISLTKKKSEWGEQEEIIFSKMSNALSGFILNLRQKADIRYVVGSDAAERLATSVTQILNKEINPNSKAFSKQKTTVIITDRREDPATPLVFDWSYLSMIHECLGLDENRVKANGKDYNMFIEEDEFLKENLYSNYGEVASNLKDFLQSMSEKKKQHLKIDKFEDMQKALNSMPDIKKDAGNATKHVDITGDLSRQINLRKLLTIGELEQTMLSKDKKTDCFNVV